MLANFQPPVRIESERADAGEPHDWLSRMLCVAFRGSGSLQPRYGLAVRRRRWRKRCVYPVRRGYAVASGQHDRHRTHCQEQQEPFDVRHRLLSPNRGMFDSKPILLGEGSETADLVKSARKVCRRLARFPVLRHLSSPPNSMHAAVTFGRLFWLFQGRKALPPPTRFLTALCLAGGS